MEQLHIKELVTVAKALTRKPPNYWESLGLLHI